MWKKYKVVMLPVGKASNLLLCNNGKLAYPTTQNGYNFVRAHGNPTDQHLYILSDDKIKEGDWYYTPIKRSIEQCVSKLLIIKDSSNDVKQLKIIASTDSSLTIKLTYKSAADSSRYLSSIHRSFIDYYVSEYNKGNKIEDVMVEYGCNLVDLRFTCQKCNYPQSESMYDSNEEHKPYLKLNPDNTINLKPVKDNWTRDEVIQICK